MDQIQPTRSPDNDLQQAIDSITNQPGPEATFSDPTSAASSLTDSSDLGESVGPFPMPDAMPGNDASVGIVTPTPEPIAPIEPLSLPSLDISGENPANARVVTKPEPNALPDNSAPLSPADPAGAPNLASAPSVPPTPQDAPLTPPADPAPQPPTSPQSQPAPEPSAPGTPTISSHLDSTLSSDHASEPRPSSDLTPNPELANAPGAQKVKERALRDLVPLLDRVNIKPDQKFKLCRDIFEELHDYSVLDQAYEAASNIKDEDQRVDSLLYLVESIDGM